MHGCRKRNSIENAIQSLMKQTRSREHKHILDVSAWIWIQSHELDICNVAIHKNWSIDVENNSGWIINKLTFSVIKEVDDKLKVKTQEKLFYNGESLARSL